MKGISRLPEDMFADIAFAEEDIPAAGRTRRERRDIFAAVTFAEAGEWETAVALMGIGETDRKTRRTGRPKGPVSGLCAARV